MSPFFCFETMGGLRGEQERGRLLEVLWFVQKDQLLLFRYAFTDLKCAVKTHVSVVLLKDTTKCKLTNQYINWLFFVLRHQVKVGAFALFHNVIAQPVASW